MYNKELFHANKNDLRFKKIPATENEISVTGIV
jgi:hypothetical protein